MEPRRREAAAASRLRPAPSRRLARRLAEAHDEELVERYERLFVPRNDPRYLRRNALVAAGNSGDGGRRAELEPYLGRRGRRAREHAEWARRRSTRERRVTREPCAQEIWIAWAAPRGRPWRSSSSTSSRHGVPVWAWLTLALRVISRSVRVLRLPRALALERARLRRSASRARVRRRGRLSRSCTSSRTRPSQPLRRSFLIAGGRGAVGIVGGVGLRPSRPLLVRRVVFSATPSADIDRPSRRRRGDHVGRSARGPDRRRPRATAPERDRARGGRAREAEELRDEIGATPTSSRSSTAAPGRSRRRSSSRRPSASSCGRSRTASRSTGWPRARERRPPASSRRRRRRGRRHPPRTTGPSAGPSSRS